MTTNPPATMLTKGVSGIWICGTTSLRRVEVRTAPDFSKIHLPRDPVEDDGPLDSGWREVPGAPTVP
jgi:hypothetical protein